MRFSKIRGLHLPLGSVQNATDDASLQRLSQRRMRQLFPAGIGFKNRKRKESEARKVPALAEKTGKMPKIGYETIKRAGDLALSLAASMIMLLPMLVLGLFILIQSPGNPLFINNCVGKNGKEIKIAMFRIMRKGAYKQEKRLAPAQLTGLTREYPLDGAPRRIRSSHLLVKLAVEEKIFLHSGKPGLTGYRQAYMRNEASYGTGE